MSFTEIAEQALTELVVEPTVKRPKSGRGNIEAKRAEQRDEDDRAIKRLAREGRAYGYGLMTEGGW